MKDLSDAQLKYIGSEIARLLPLAYREMRTHTDLLTQLDYINQIEKSEYTLQLLRIEWKRRHTNSF